MKKENPIKSITRKGSFYAMNDLEADLVPLSVVLEIREALETTLECLEMGGFGKSYAEDVARRALEIGKEKV